MKNIKSFFTLKNIKKAWQILIIILLVLLMSSVIQYTANIYSVHNTGENQDGVYVLSKYGSRGTEVRQIQTKLKQLGYYKGSIDGIYGTQTKNAVIAFQKNCGITADGIAGPKTLLYMGLGSGSSSSAYSSNDIYLLAKVIEGEARGESYTGQVAVGAVILNRVEHSSFPNSISGVVYQSGAFDCVYDSNWSVEPSSTAKKAAQDAINGWDPSGGAIYYYNPAKTTNKWMLSRPVIAVIGRHYFCT